MRSHNLFAAVVCAAVVSLSGASAAAQTLPLVRYQSEGGAGAYAAHPERRKKFQADPSRWKEYGTVGHCQTAKRPGTTALLNLRRPAEFGGQHFYTTDVGEAVKVQNWDARWVADDFNKGVVCFVAASKLPGSVAVYRYRQPSGQGYIHAFGGVGKAVLFAAGETSKG